MALTDFKPQFDEAYQEIFQKVLVSKEVANTRFKAKLSYGESVERVAYDITSVRVRAVSRGSASTIDSITDSSELLTVNQEYEAVFHVSDGEVKQAGPLNPGEVIGGKVAHKVAQHLDATFFAEVLNADQTFDTGDLTTLASSGVPFAESASNVPIMGPRMAAKLLRANQTLMNLCYVTDSYGAAGIEQYLNSKDIDLAGVTFKNGYAGPFSRAEMYVSENLTGTAVLGLATQPTDGDTVVINGITFTFKTTLGVTAGNVLIGASADTARANLTALINAPGTTTANGVALSSTNQELLTDTYRITAVNDATANTMTITGVGSGALTLSETFTDVTDAWAKNCVHAYYGKKGAIDMVIQDMKEVDMRPTADRRGTNVFSSYLAGIKTFADGSKQFLDVLLAR